MARNAIKSDFRSSKMATHFVKKLKKNAIELQMKVILLSSKMVFLTLT